MKASTAVRVALAVIGCTIVSLPLMSINYTGIDGSAQTCSACYCETNSQGECIVVDENCELLTPCVNCSGIISNGSPWDEVYQLPVGWSKARAVDFVDVPFNNDSTVPMPGELSPGIGTARSSCLSQDGWCASDTAVHHPIWFFFVAPPHGSVTITTAGSLFDTKIAVWSIGNVRNLRTYKKIAANDNEDSLTLTSCVKGLELTPRDTFWVQVDGHKGATGDGVITLKTSAASSIHPVTIRPNHPNVAQIRPNPIAASGTISFTMPEAGHAIIEVFDSRGILVSTVFDGTLRKGENAVPIAATDLPQGLYYVQVRAMNLKTQGKLVKVPE